MTTHLVIGDPHATPGVSNDRFLWLGRAILDIRPDVVVCMGDFADLDSLCNYDRNTRSFEGRRYKLDLTCIHDALSKTLHPWASANAKLADKKKRKIQLPRMVMLGGNHDEGRIEKATNVHPELHGTISIDDLGYKALGWEYVPFLEPIEIDGIHYCHYFKSGNSATYNAISGISIGRSLLQRNHASSTVGHSHVLDIASAVRPDGSRIWGLSAGCYTPAEPSYAKGSDKFWWRGLIVKRNVRNGDYDLETISLQEVERRYG